MATLDVKDFVKEKDVIEALKCKEGRDAEFKSYSVRNFTKKGDNFVATVMAVSIIYSKGTEDMETQMVVKINTHEKPEMDTLVRCAFLKEFGFYGQIVPLLNNELKNIGEDPLKLPKMFHYAQDSLYEIIYLEDLRQLGYKPFSRDQDMDYEHTERILRELARLHGSSVLLMERHNYDRMSLLKKYPAFTEFYECLTEESSGLQMKTLLPSSLENIACTLEDIEGYEQAAACLRALKPTCLDDFFEILKCKDPFATISHGDCWSNNFLFRYSESGKVIDCRLIDFQFMRIASPALDLNYLFYCGLGGNLRQQYTSNFLSLYYNSFAKVLSEGKLPMKFTLDELKQEFRAKNTFGLFVTAFTAPVVLSDSDIAIEDLAAMADNQRAEYDAQTRKGMKNSKRLHSRLLSLIDEMMQEGVLG